MIRKAVLEDSKIIADIEKENFTWFFRRKEETVKRLIQNKNFEVYVFIDNWVVWYIFLQLVKWYLYIENISVSKSWQWKWIWKLLMLKSEEVAKRIWYKWVALDVLTNNEKAIWLYTSFWYNVVRGWKFQQKMFKKLT